MTQAARVAGLCMDPSRTTSVLWHSASLPCLAAGEYGPQERIGEYLGKLFVNLPTQISEPALQLGPPLQVITSTENLYNRVMQKSKTSHADEDNPLQQLEAIGHFIADLGHILRLAKGQ